MSDGDAQIRELAAALRAHASWEAEISDGGWPEVSAPPQTARANAAEPTTRTHAPAQPIAVSAPMAAPAQGPIVVPSGERRVVLASLAEQAAACTRCGLHASRTKSVFARGNPDAELVFVGEGPDSNEDQQGEPFVGQAGLLLDKMIGAMGFTRDAVYICNVVKCRPPENRNPLPREAAACEPFLVGQLDAIRPKVIVALGRVAGQGLGCFSAETKGWRGTWSQWRGVPVMPTHHPADLLRSPEMKRPAWEDLQAVMAKLGVSR